MCKKLFLILSMLAVIASSFAGNIIHAEVPEPKGDIYVQDFAGILSEQQKQGLNQLGRKLEDQTKAQIAVLTIDSLDGSTPEEYALEAFRKYGLGDKELENGVLLLMAFEENDSDKSARIEVGYGLEGALPDGKVGRILDEYTMPYWKEGKPDQAIILTYEQLFNEVAAEYGLDETADSISDYSLTENSSNAGQESGMATWKKILIAAIIIIFIIIDMTFFGGTFTYMLLHILSAIARNGGGRGGGGSRGGGGGSSGGGGASRGW
ncbi:MULTISPECIES: TPM domain-containing protein [Bacillaceae]|uniref:TPM domain-containing protein n=1 Tax=Bacillaceae TaxID=186817 RepID=UPI00069FBCC2|nr:TPM domain-containing protein [Bacillus sp. FJAT-27916]